MKPVAALALAALSAACVASAKEPAPRQLAQQPPQKPAVQTSVTQQGHFVFAGELTQGGWIRGQAPAGAISARLDNQPLTLDPQGNFFAAFDRDAPATARLTATVLGGAVVESVLAISPRAWPIENIDAARRPGGVPTDAFLAMRQPELARIAAARAIDSGSQGWRQNFIQPVPGRISGRFGAQRVYRGEPGAYHSGMDIAGGAGTPYVAPADGVVVLAAAQPFTLEGHLVIIDHGQGLNSSFLHASEILVHEGDVVKQGQVIGRVGATGRATGPHLHWSIKWRDARLDPLLFLHIPQP
ncbi:MAG: hypothetical protein RLZZ08_483 [Pseudomonadota bacterium]|jgi:murein DD-endopeptidase MepM/ murein hydrolase activator NlpD